MSLPASPLVCYQTIFLLCLVVLSIIILVIGVFLFYFKPKRRRITGSVLIAVGILELPIYSIIKISGNGPFLFGGLTILFGLVVVLFSIEKIAKSQFWS